MVQLQESVKYTSVPRDWPTTCSLAEHTYPTHNNTGYSAMQRWAQEPMREQPYNNIAAVKVMKDAYDNIDGSIKAGYYDFKGNQQEGK